MLKITNLKKINNVSHGTFYSKADDSFKESSAFLTLNNKKWTVKIIFNRGNKRALGCIYVGRRLFNLKWGRYYVAQIDESDCGVAALAMIFKYYGSTIPLFKLRKLTQTSLEGTTIWGIIRASSKLKISAKAIQASKHLFQDREISYPFIVHVQKNQELLHYYVVLDVKNDKVTIADPDEDIGIVHMLKKDLLAEWTGVAILFEKAKDYHRIVEKPLSLWQFQKLIVEKKHLLVPIFLSVVFITFLELISAYFFQNLIDSFIPKKLITEMTIISIGLIIGHVCSSISMYLNQSLILKLERNISKNIIMMYIKHVFHLPINFFINKTNGDIISRFQDTEKIVTAISSCYVVGIMQSSIFFALGIILALQNIHLFGVSVISIPIYVMIIIMFVRPFERQNKNVMAASETVTSELISDFSCMELIKSMNWTDVVLHKSNIKLEKLLNSTQKFMKMDQIQKTLKELVDHILEIMVLMIGAHEVFAQRISLGELVAFNTLLCYFMNPLQDIVGLQSKIQSAKVALNRLNEVLSVPQEKLKGDSLHHKNTDADIKVENVCFGYGDGKVVLANISCSILRQQKVLLQGQSGCGKSTFAKLLAGFLTCHNGRIIVGEQDIKNLNPVEWRKHVLYVPQIPYIFNTTIFENLLMDCSRKISDDKIKTVCELVGLDEVINQLPLGLDTVIGEHGSKLSGGQKQRLCLARALLTDAEVLILDEVTSSLDFISEEQIIKNICNLTKKTVIIITHRLEVAKYVDQIIKI